LCACWQTSAAAKLRSGFERGVRKVTEGIALLPAEVLDGADWKRFDSAGRLFWNMNTTADYEEARRILEAERKGTKRSRSTTSNFRTCARVSTSTWCSIT